MISTHVASSFGARAPEPLTTVTTCTGPLMAAVVVGWAPVSRERSTAARRFSSRHRQHSSQRRGRQRGHPRLALVAAAAAPTAAVVVPVRAAAAGGGSGGGWGDRGGGRADGRQSVPTSRGRTIGRRAEEEGGDGTTRPGQQRRRRRQQHRQGDRDWPLPLPPPLLTLLSCL